MTNAAVCSKPSLRTCHELKLCNAKFTEIDPVAVNENWTKALITSSLQGPVIPKERLSVADSQMQAQKNAKQKSTRKETAETSRRALSGRTNFGTNRRTAITSGGTTILMPVRAVITVVSAPPVPNGEVEGPDDHAG
jgi:hypothetical protein